MVFSHNSNVSSMVNVDELIKENHELKLRNLMKQLSFDSSCSSDKIYKDTSSSGLSSNTNEQFLSLDTLPEPPSISIDQLRQLNQAFNKLESSLPPDEQKIRPKSISLKSERSNSFESLASCSSNTTLDVNTTKRAISRCSTVDIRPKSSGKTIKKFNNIVTILATSQNNQKRLQITSLKSLTQMPSFDEEDNDLKKADQRLNDLLESLKAEVDQKRAVSNRNNNDWLNLLEMNDSL